MSKLKELKELRNKLNLTVKGIENLPEGNAIYVSNHVCLLDGLYIPAALNKDVVSIVSSRLVYKKNDRLKNVEKYLNAFPVEAHGGKVYSDLCLKYVLEILKNNIDINMFPEGAYIEDNSIVTKGRVGAAKLLFDIRDEGIYYDLVPISINIKNKIDDLDNFVINDNEVEITISKPINTNDQYYDYTQTNNEKEKRKIYHDIIDESMKIIALSMNKNFSNEYIELYPKGNVIFSNGEVVDKIEAQDKRYVLRYENELINRTNKYIKDLKK